MNTITPNVNDSLAVNCPKVDSLRNYRLLDGNLFEKYSSSDFEYERKIDTNGFARSIINWLANLLGDLFDIPSIAVAEDIVWYIIYGFAIILIALAIYFIVRAIIKHKGNWFFNDKEPDFNFEFATAENSTEEDLESLLVRYKSEENYRFASRVVYLLMVKKLARSGHLNYDPEKTNRDLRRQLKSDDIRNLFDRIIYVFENVWYGEKEIIASDFNTMENSFNLLNKKLNG
jgi:hypothetical protein